MESEAWKLGHDAFNDGVSLADNPYSMDQSEYDDWDSGWCAAQDEHLEADEDD